MMRETEQFTPGLGVQKFVTGWRGRWWRSLVILFRSRSALLPQGLFLSAPRGHSICKQLMSSVCIIFLFVVLCVFVLV